MIRKKSIELFFKYSKLVTLKEVIHKQYFCSILHRQRELLPQLRIYSQLV